MHGRRADDNAEGLWRVHDKLYDLTAFVDNHPGGREWLTLTEVKCKLFAFSQTFKETSDSRERTSPKPSKVITSPTRQRKCFQSFTCATLQSLETIN